MIEWRCAGKMQNVEVCTINKDDRAGCRHECGNKNREGKSDGEGEKISTDFSEPVRASQNDQRKSDLKFNGVVGRMKNRLDESVPVDSMCEVGPCQPKRHVDVRQKLILKRKCQALHRIGREHTA